MYYGVISSFSSAFLLDKGYTNSEIGIILAAASVISVFLQPALADIADRSKKLDVIGVSEISTVMMMVFGIGLFIFQRKSVALWVVYVLLMAWELALQPIFNSFARKLAEGGTKINFGICRAGGSMGYAIFTTFLGSFVEKYGTGILPGTGMTVMAILLALLLLCQRTFRRSVSENYQERIREDAVSYPEEPAEDIDLKTFVKKNRLFIVLSFFILILFFQNAILNNFMYQIVEGVGGDSGDLGRVYGVMAGLEVPALFFFDNIHKRFSCSTLLKVASIAFALKLITMFMADSVAMIYAAHFFHIFSFPLFLPAIVQFINEIMEKGEAVRGQAVYTTAITIASIFASILGGMILDASGPKLMLLVSVVLTVIGAAGVIFLVGKFGEKAENP